MAAMSPVARAMVVLSVALILQPTQAAPQHWQQGTALISSPLGGAEVYNACPFTVHSNIVHAPRPGADGPPEEIATVLAAGQSAQHPYLHDPGMGISWKLAPANDATAPVQFEWTWVPDQHRSYWDLSMIDAGVAGRAIKRSLLRRHDGQEQGYQQWEAEQQDPAAVTGSDGQEPGSEGQGDEEAAAPASPSTPAEPPAEEEGSEWEAPAPAPAPPAGGNGIAHPFAQHGMTLQPMRDGEAVNGEGMCGMVACNAGEAACIAAYNYPEDWSRQHDCPEGVTLRLTLCG